MLLRLDNVSLAYGARALLDRASLQIDERERVCLVGRNGEGKSSLLRLLRNEIEPDGGSIWIQPGARLAHLAQDITEVDTATVEQLVGSGLPQMARALQEYHRLTEAGVHTPAQHEQLDRLLHELDAGGGWQFEQRVATVLSRLQLPAQERYNTLSGGWRRRALLARALVSEPDILLLDEPTNHLDIGAIEWIEQAMLDYQGALLLVSHDRAFINRLATRVVELDRGTLLSVPGNYDHYRQLKAQQLAAETQQNALFDKRLAQEEVWIRKGVEARRTRNEGRVRALHELRAQRSARRERIGRVELTQQQTDDSAALVFEAEHVEMRFDERLILRDFSTRIMRGDRVGLVGPNGAGKSTLIKLLLGELEPDAGHIRRGGRLEIAYYDQQREQLQLDQSVMVNVSGRNDHVLVNGENRHVSGYLRDFLFRPDQLQMPARALSGGERNRLLLARLFARPANLLVLDEPTNDLDIDTLELLEEFVATFPGTLLLVSHDRAFLDHVATSLLVFEGSGKVSDFVGGYSDWARYQSASGTRTPPPVETIIPARGAAAKKPRLSYKDQRELARLPDSLQQLEAQKQQIEARLTDRDLYTPAAATQLREQIAQLQTLQLELDGGYARWAQLEALAAGT